MSIHSFWQCEAHCVLYSNSLHVSHQDIDSQLRAAAEAFLENDDGCVIDSVGREVKLSQIFKWYKADFGGTDEKVLLKYIITLNSCTWKMSLWFAFKAIVYPEIKNSLTFMFFLCNTKGDI